MIVCGLRRVAIAAVLACSSLAGRAAAPAPQPPSSIVREAFRLYDAQQTAEADTAFTRAVAEAQAAGDAGAEAEALRGLGLVKYRRAEYDAAREVLLRALARFESHADRLGIARVHAQLGSVAFMTGDIPKARELYEQSIQEYEAAGELKDKAFALRNLAFVLPASDPRLDDSLATALAIARQVGDRRLEGLVLHSQGDRAFNAGDFGAARRLLMDATARLDGPTARADRARVLTSLGRLHRAHGQYDAAVGFYRQAVLLQRRSGDAGGQAQSLNAIGLAVNLLGRPREALASFRRALAAAQSQHASGLADLIEANMAQAHIDLGELSRAVALLEPILDRTRDDYNLTLAGMRLAEAYRRLGRFDRAVELANRALATGKAGVEELPLLYHVRAGSHEALGSADLARADVEQALAAVERLRARLVPLDFMKRGFGERYQELIGFSIRLHHRQGRHGDALEIAERARARAFLDLLASRPMSRDAPSPSTAALESAASSAPVSLDQITAAARRLQSAIVSYWVGPEQTVVWVISADGRVQSASVPVAASRVAALVRRAAGGDADLVAGQRPGPVWRDLYDLLIRPIRPFLPAQPGALLTIVPHGSLFRLSFAALVDERGRYLLEDYRLHYTPAAALLSRTPAAPATPERFAAMRYLLVANPETPPPVDGVPLPTLPGTASEVQAIAKALPAGAARMLIGRDAREGTVRSALGGSSVVHFATHGVLRDDRAFDSFLALGRSAAAAGLDGRLTTAEIYGLTMTTDLVVLSACRTARGPLTGDGVVGMTRAFLYAGAASVVASVWDVPDEATAQLMPAFYRAWPLAREKATALRVAQLDLLQRLRTGRVTIETPGGRTALPEHPFLWAGFILIGEP